MAQVRTRSREADTCRQCILPRLCDAGWRDEQIIEDHYFRDGRIVPTNAAHYFVLSTESLRGVIEPVE